MSRYLLIVAAGVAALSLAGPAHARGPSHSVAGSHSSFYRGPSNSFSTGHSYLSNYGTKFSHGYYFGRNNFYWNRQCWSSRYGCNCYWNPYASCWYYWYAPGSCYYPLSYISYAPPTVVVTPSVTVTPTVAVTPGVSVGSAGPGAAMPPAGPPVP